MFISSYCSIFGSNDFSGIILSAIMLIRCKSTIGPEVSHVLS